jgi:hypothetical protein
VEKIEDSEKRVAKILGPKDSSRLIEVSSETLKVYHNYLSKNLSFSFEAKYSCETGFLKTVYYDIEVTDILNMDDCDGVEFYGLFCRGKRDKRKIIVPLAEVEMKQKGRNKQLIEDYRSWFWNYR